MEDDSDILHYSPVAQLITGTQTGLKAASDIRTIAMTQFYVGDSDRHIVWATDTMNPPVGGYYVATDTLTFIQKSSQDAINSVRFMVIIEAEKVKLTANDVNFLLVNQTFTG